MEILRADKTHLAELARLFDLYRQFYECEPDLALARIFLEERLERSESIVFAARIDGDKLAGFVQLYPSFCSVEATKILILYDLYVDAPYRQRGIGEELMNRASRHAREAGAQRLDLLTAHSNHAGQHLYEKLGYRKTNQDFFAYSLYV